MSRPASCSGGYGLTPVTGCVVDFWKYSGTISTSPPTATTTMIIAPMFFSTSSCVNFIACSPSCRRRQLCTIADRDQCLYGLATDDRAHDVVGHDQHPAQEQRPAEKPDRIE